MLRTTQVRRWVLYGLMALGALSLATWAITRETLPPVIRIAAAEKGGLYYSLATSMKPHLAKKTGKRVVVLDTQGTLENEKLLHAGRADLAILQAGAVSMEGLSALAGLYPDVIQVIVRKSSQMESIRDLAGRRVVLGSSHSGYRKSATTLLDHYSIDVSKLRETNRYFGELLSDPSLDAAIVTTGFLNPDLHKLLGTGRFKILPILDAEALAVHYAYFQPITIPRALFKGNPPVPKDPIPTVATVAFLAARKDVPHLLVTAALHAIYKCGLRLKLPIIMAEKEAAKWSLYPLHPASMDYYNPYRSIGILANFVESIAGIKELLFAFFAGVYLLWSRWERFQRKEQEKELSIQKERLDIFLGETARIERAQMETSDPKLLRSHFDEITRIKLEALQLFTDETLRSKSLFTLFLAQCANLTRKLEYKLNLVLSDSDARKPREQPKT